MKQNGYALEFVYVENKTVKEQEHLYNELGKFIILQEKSLDGTLDVGI